LKDLSKIGHKFRFHKGKTGETGKSYQVLNSMLGVGVKRKPLGLDDLPPLVFLLDGEN